MNIKDRTNFQKKKKKNIKDRTTKLVNHLKKKKEKRRNPKE